MDVHPRLRLSQEALEAYCRKWKIVRLEIFGSIHREDFRTDSDVDVLVTFAPDAHWGLMSIGRVERELGEMIGRPVDLVLRQGIEQSPNYIRRRHILETAVPFYAA
jgi:predicted nucleotidyltransferase